MLRTDRGLVGGTFFLLWPVAAAEEARRENVPSLADCLPREAILHEMYFN